MESNHIECQLAVSRIFFCMSCRKQRERRLLWILGRFWGIWIWLIFATISSLGVSSTIRGLEALWLQILLDMFASTCRKNTLVLLMFFCDLVVCAVLYGGKSGCFVLYGRCTLFWMTGNSTFLINMNNSIHTRNITLFLCSHFKSLLDVLIFGVIFILWNNCFK